MNGREDTKVKLRKLDDFEVIPHFWDKKVLYITPVKKDNNHRHRVGLQMYPLPNNDKYTLVIETVFNVGCFSIYFTYSTTGLPVIRGATVELLY